MRFTIYFGPNKFLLFIFKFNLHSRNLPFDVRLSEKVCLRLWMPLPLNWQSLSVAFSEIEFLWTLTEFTILYALPLNLFPIPIHLLFFLFRWILSSHYRDSKKTRNKWKRKASISPLYFKVLNFIWFLCNVEIKSIINDNPWRNSARFAIYPRFNLALTMYRSVEESSWNQIFPSNFMHISNRVLWTFFLHLFRLSFYSYKKFFCKLFQILFKKLHIFCVLI